MKDLYNENYKALLKEIKDLNMYFFHDLFLFIFLLKDNCFTEFCCFLSNLSMNQP